LERVDLKNLPLHIDYDVEWYCVTDDLAKTALLRSAIVEKPSDDWMPIEDLD